MFIDIPPGTFGNQVFCLFLLLLVLFLLLLFLKMSFSVLSGFKTTRHS